MKVGPPVFQSEDLIDLIEDLRAAGYSVGTQQCVDIHDLLIALAAHEQWPSDTHQLKNWLAPILCSSPKEQEDFYERFSQWLEQRTFVLKAEVEEEEIPPSVGPGEQRDPKRLSPTRKFRWKALALVALFMLTAGVVSYLIYQQPQALSGKVVDQAQNPVANAEVTMIWSTREETVLAGDDGRFTLQYRRQDLPATLTITEEEHETASLVLASAQAEPLLVSLRPKEPKPEVKPPPVVVKPGLENINPTPQPIPTLTPQTDSRPATSTRGLLGIGIPVLGGALLILLAWWLRGTYRRRMLLQKLGSATTPHLEQLLLKAPAEQILRGYPFRRIAQELRRHRQQDSHELDELLTVKATVNRGGLFTPLYKQRKTVPEYLVLVDRASRRDHQTRLQDELINRLVAEDIFVDRYYFQSDPRTCLNDKATQYHTLRELAALYPDHYLVLISDGAGLFNPMTGEFERGLETLGSWSRRALLTPEPPAFWGRQESELKESGLLVLPANEDGLAALVSTTGPDAAPRPRRDAEAHPYPEMLRERPRRWMERSEPRPEIVDRLWEQLRRYLNARGFYWLSACAVYPMLSWELTLYLGFKLLGSREEVEANLPSLVRLPWLRHGVMPDWIRLRLISGLSTGQESAVRRALEDLLNSALERPSDGIRLDIASSAGGQYPSDLRGRLQRLGERLRSFKNLKPFKTFFSGEERHSTFHEYVFLTFMSGRKPHKLAVRVPDILRQLLLPDARALNPFSAIRRAWAAYPALYILLPLLPLLLSAVLVAIWLTGGTSTSKAPAIANNANTNTSTTSGAPSGSQPETSPTPVKLYLTMTEEEKTAFINERAQHIAAMMGGRSYDFPPEAVNLIKQWVDNYAKRAGNNFTGLWRGDTRFIIERGQLYAPTIIQAFKEQKVPPVIGLYIPFAETEYTNVSPGNSAGAAGIYQFLGTTAEAYGVPASERTNVSKMAPGVARYFRDTIMRFGNDSTGVVLSIAGYNRAAESISRDLRNVLNEPDNAAKERSFWTLVANQSKLDEFFQRENINYVPRFFAVAIVGETPLAFGLNTKPLSAFDPTPGESPVTEQQPTAGDAVGRLMNRIGADTGAYVSETGVKDVMGKVNEYRNSAALTGKILMASRTCPEIDALAKANNLNPKLVAYVAIAQTQDGGDPLLIARRMLPKLLTLRATFGTGTANSSLLTIAAYTYPFEPQLGSQLRVSHPLNESLVRAGRQSSTVEFRVARSVWFLREKGMITDEAYDLVLRTVAFGIIAENPREYGLNIDPLVC